MATNRGKNEYLLHSFSRIHTNKSNSAHRVNRSWQPSWHMNSSHQGSYDNISFIWNSKRGKIIKTTVHTHTHFKTKPLQTEKVGCFVLGFLLLFFRWQVLTVWLRLLLKLAILPAPSSHTLGLQPCAPCPGRPFQLSQRTKLTSPRNKVLYTKSKYSYEFGQNKYRIKNSQALYKWKWWCN